MTEITITTADGVEVDLYFDKKPDDYEIERIAQMTMRQLANVPGLVCYCVTFFCKRQDGFENNKKTKLDGKKGGDAW